MVASLCALCAGLIEAPGAAAAVSSLHECLEAETGTETRFADSSCSSPSKTGTFRLVPLAGTQGVTATQTSPFVFKATPLGISLEFTCNELMSSEASSENTASGFQGEGVFTFSECTVSKPAGCTVRQPIQFVKLKWVSEDLEGGVMRTKYTPKEGSAFVTITFENCGLLNGGHTTTGVVRSQATSPETEEFSPTSGSEIEFFGARVELSGKLHYATASEPTKTLYRETP